MKKIWYNTVMYAGFSWHVPRLLLLLPVAAMSGATLARTIVLPAQPVSPFADTEVSTNVPINGADIGYTVLP